MDTRPSPSGRSGRRSGAPDLASAIVCGRVLAPLAATAAVLTIGSPCFAQVAGLPTFGIAAPQIQPGVDTKQIGLDVTGAYDNNVARSSAELAAERGIKQQDFYVLPAGDLTFSRVFGRETIFLEATAGYKAYARNSILDRSNIQIGGGAVGQFSMCQGTLAGAYNHAQVDLANLPVSVESGHPEAVAKDTQTNAVVNFTAICGRSIGFAPTGTVSSVWVTNDSTAFSAIDARVFSGSGGVTYRSPVFGSATLNGQYSQTEYPNRVVPGGGGTGLGFHTVGGGVTLARAVGSRLSGSLSVDYTKLDPGNGFTQGFSGVTYNGNISYAVNPELNVSVVAGKGVTPSNELEASFMITEIYGVQAGYALGSRLNLSVGLSRTHQQYEGILFPILVNVTEQTTSSVYGNASYQLTRRISIAPSVTYSRRTANLPVFAYTDVLTAVTVRSAF